MRVLQEHPEWREKVREVLFTEEERQMPSQLSQLIEVVRELVRAHQEGNTRLDRLEQTVAQLVVSHQDALARLDRLEAIIAELLESHRQLQESHQQALLRLDRLEAALQRLTDLHERLSADIGTQKGKVLEMTFLSRGPALFGPYVRRPRVVSLADFLEDLREQGHPLSQSEWKHLYAIDLLLSARHPKTGEALYLVVEVSWMLYPADVERAVQRAEILKSCGVNAYPAVAGEGIVPEAKELAESRAVPTLVDGTLVVEGFLA